MKPAAERLRADLDALTVDLPTVPVYHNVDAAVAGSGDAIKEALVRQLYSPVRWAECVRAMAAPTMIEMGPGKVLSGLGRRIDKSVTTLPAETAAGLEKALAAASGS
jgi:[acyl-carrier-protein] S-malonyltransferase